MQKRETTEKDIKYYEKRIEENRDRIKVLDKRMKLPKTEGHEEYLKKMKKYAEDDLEMIKSLLKLIKEEKMKTYKSE